MEFDSIVRKVRYILDKKNFEDYEFNSEKKEYAFFVSHETLALLRREALPDSIEVFYTLGNLYVFGLNVYGVDIDNESIYLGKKY